MSKALIFGGAGQAGAEFQTHAKAAGWRIVAPIRSEADIEAPGTAAAWITSEKPDWVVNFSAFHALDQCETAFARALAVNAAAVREMAAAARDAGAWFVTVSTDYAFNGRAQAPYPENAPVGPIQAYGVSKVAGEFAALAAHPEGAIVARTCGLYGHAASRQRGGNFVEKRLAEAAHVDRLEVGSDLRCNPTSATSFAAALWALMNHPGRKSGLYHLAAEGVCDWASFTAAIFETAELPVEVVRVDRKGQYGPVRRPPFSALANIRARDLGIRLPHWKDDLGCYIASRNA